MKVENFNDTKINTLVYGGRSGQKLGIQHHLYLSILVRTFILPLEYQYMIQNLELKTVK